MEFRECIGFANQHPTAYLATTDDKQPRVRPMGLWFADKEGFYFQTETVKAVYRQLAANKNVEVCFYDPTSGAGLGTVLRVAGEVEFVDDISVKRRVLEDRPFLSDMGVKGPDDPLLVVFRIAKGEAFFWTMENNMKESQVERVRFGRGP